MSTATSPRQAATMLTVDVLSDQALACQGQTMLCPLDAMRLTGYPRPDDAEIRFGLAHLASCCPRCWRAMDRIVVPDELKYLTRKVIHPVVALHGLIRSEPHYAPTVRLDRVLCEVTCQATGSLSEEGYYRLLLESWLYGYRLPIPNREAFWPRYGDWLELMGAAGMPESEALSRLWRECELEHSITRAEAGEITVHEARSQLQDWLAQEGDDELAFWTQQLLEVRLAGVVGHSGSALETLDALLAGERQRDRVDPVVYEFAMDVKAERYRRGEDPGLEARLNWYLRILDERDLEADDHPCIAARAARHVEALVMDVVMEASSTPTDGFEAGLLYRLALRMREIYPSLCKELVMDRWLGHSAVWLEEIEWEEWLAYGCADHLRTVFAAGYMMLHPEDIDLPLHLPWASDTQKESFRRVLDSIRGFSVIEDVFRDGKRLATRFSIQGATS